ncbi:MAG: hypothetical protein IJO74_03455 [Clostridia bacterium]|nr:hypothetical protein [Clostridia bacterium]
MVNLEWIFEGIGTELLSLAIGAVVGGLTGYKIGVKNKAKQNQKAGKNSTQSQIGSVTINGK